jgi:nitrogen regulatory protein P-II 2
VSGGSSAGIAVLILSAEVPRARLECPQPLARTTLLSENHSMKLVIAVIKPFKLDEVQRALVSVGIHGMPRMRIDVAVPTDRVDAVVGAIATAAKTGQIGDGNVFVVPLERAVRIRTGETDVEAL